MVDYDIEKELECTDGVTIIRNEIEYDERDILIVDYKNKKNYLLKKAYYIGHTNIYGTPDGGTKTRFQTQVFFFT